MKKAVFFGGALLIALSISVVTAQEAPIWDNPVSRGWPQGCSVVEIPSTIDGKLQPAVFLQAEGTDPRPLVVSLHTWSGGYDQQDTLVWLCLEKNYNYIHPHFRGPNKNPEACGSELVISDIDDAIVYAIEHASVDMKQIHVTGVSGGGYATLLAWMKSLQPVATFSAWVPISDIGSWYHESVGRGQHYYRDISLCTNGGRVFAEGHFPLGEEEAVKRSPMHMTVPVERRRNSRLYIYAGIHDGYTGSVPITHSLLFYNKVVGELDPAATDALVPEKDIIELVASRNFVATHKPMMGDRVVHYRKNFRNQVEVTIFEGNHEMVVSRQSAVLSLQ